MHEGNNNQLRYVYENDAQNMIDDYSLNAYNVFGAYLFNQISKEQLEYTIDRLNTELEQNNLLGIPVWYLDEYDGVDDLGSALNDDCCIHDGDDRCYDCDGCGHCDNVGANPTTTIPLPSSMLKLPFQDNPGVVTGFYRGLELFSEPTNPEKYVAVLHRVDTTYVSEFGYGIEGQRTYYKHAGLNELNTVNNESEPVFADYQDAAIYYSMIRNLERDADMIFSQGKDIQTKLREDMLKTWEFARMKDEKTGLPPTDKMDLLLNWLNQNLHPDQDEAIKLSTNICQYETSGDSILVRGNNMKLHGSIQRFVPMRIDDDNSEIELAVMVKSFANNERSDGLYLVPIAASNLFGGEIKIV